MTATPWTERPLWARVALIVSACVCAFVVDRYIASLLSVAGLSLAANQLVTPSWVMKQIGIRLVNNWKFAQNVLRSYDGQYKQAGAKMGFTVTARLPQRYKVNKGTALNPQPVVDTVVPITLTDQANVGIEFSTASLTMEVDNYREKCIAPAVDAMVNQVDFDGLSRMYLETYYTVGTPNVVPASPNANDTYLAAGVKLDDASVPGEGRIAMLTPAMHAALAKENLTVFNPSQQIGKIFRKGQFADEALGISEWYKDQNVATHTIGALGGTPLVDGAGQVGNVINLKGWTSAAATRLKKGDVLQFAGSYSINPQSYQSNSSLMDFVVMADADSTAGGLMSVTISPAIVPASALQTCSGSPANEAVVTIFGHASSHANKLTRQGLIYHPEAYAMVMADLEKPGGLWVSESISNAALGVAIRFLKAYSIDTDMSPARVDSLYGWKAVRPELAVRVCS